MFFDVLCMFFVFSEAEKSAADIFDESRIASMTAMEIREAGDKNQQAFRGTMEAVRAAQTMITTLQIEAKNKDTGLTGQRTTGSIRNSNDFKHFHDNVRRIS